MSTHAQESRTSGLRLMASVMVLVVVATSHASLLGHASLLAHAALLVHTGVGSHSLQPR